MDPRNKDRTAEQLTYLKHVFQNIKTTGKVLRVARQSNNAGSKKETRTTREGGYITWGGAVVHDRKVTPTDTKTKRFFTNITTVNK